MLKLRSIYQIKLCHHQTRVSILKLMKLGSNKLVNGLDDIAITLQYESLIEKILLNHTLRELNIMTVKTTVSTKVYR